MPYASRAGLCKSGGNETTSFADSRILLTIWREEVRRLVGDEDFVYLVRARTLNSLSKFPIQNGLENRRRDGHTTDLRQVT